MAAIGGFESRPRLAVAVSGGSDSLALALNARDWALGRGGDVVALTLDHGLRDTEGERNWLAACLAKLGLPQIEFGPWPRPDPATGIEAGARAGRYAALEAWCRTAGVLHLLVGHTADDQAETVLLRLAGGTGPDGLASMPLVRPAGAMRVLRPLLACRRATLQAQLRANGLGWVSDPTNADSELARGRLRRSWAVLGREGLSVPRLAATARRCGADRAQNECQVAAAAARWLHLAPTGLVWLDAALLTAEPALGRRLLGRAVRLADGRSRPPPPDGVERARTALAGGAATRSLGGAVVRRLGARLLVHRAPGRFTACVTVPGDGTTATLDGRLRLWRDRPGPALTAQALTPALWGRLAAAAPGLKPHMPPGKARFALAVLVAGDGAPMAVAGLAGGSSGPPPVGVAPVAAEAIGPSPWRSVG